jgi:hypothetical protein
VRKPITGPSRAIYFSRPGEAVKIILCGVEIHIFSLTCSVNIIECYALYYSSADGPVGSVFFRGGLVPLA